MKKKLFGVILAAALVVTQAVTVFAAGSRTSDVALAGDSASNYEVYEASAESFAAVSAQAPQTVEAILEINSGSASLGSLVETIRGLISAGSSEVNMTEDQVAALEAELTGKSLVSNFFEISPVGNGAQDENGNYVVTLSVPSLTESMTNVRLLHYSTERALWEVVTPSDVNYGSQTVTAAFADLSPVAVIADVDTAAGDTAVGTSPQTGVASVWMIWLGAAVVLAVVAAVTIRKVRR